MKPNFRMNENGVKSSCDMFRNIDGKYFIQWTSMDREFPKLKKICKELKIAHRIINGEFFVEKDCAPKLAEKENELMNSDIILIK